MNTLWFYWWLRHSHWSSSCGLSPIFIMEGNTHFTACLVKMNLWFFFPHPSSQIPDFIQGFPCPFSVCWRHQGKNPWSVEGMNWALGLCRDRGWFSWETGTVWKAGAIYGYASQSSKDSHCQQHFKEYFSVSPGLSEVWLGEVLAQRGDVSSKTARQYPHPNTRTLRLWGDIRGILAPLKTSVFAPR